MERTESYLFVTSRDEPDIRQSLNSFDLCQIEMRNAGIAGDIANFISRQLNEDRQLRKLSPYHDQIRIALVNGAEGVYVNPSSKIIHQSLANIKEQISMGRVPIEIFAILSQK